MLFVYSSLETVFSHGPTQCDGFPLILSARISFKTPLAMLGTAVALSLVARRIAWSRGGDGTPKILPLRIPR